MTNIILQISWGVYEMCSYFPLWTITVPTSELTTRVIFKREKFDNRSLFSYLFFIPITIENPTPRTYEDEKGTMVHLTFQFNELGVFAELIAKTVLNY